MCKCTVFKEIAVVYTVDQVVLIQVSGWRKEGNGGGEGVNFWLKCLLLMIIQNQCL